MTNTDFDWQIDEFITAIEYKYYMADHIHPYMAG